MLSDTWSPNKTVHCSARGNPNGQRQGKMSVPMVLAPSETCLLFSHKMAASKGKRPSQNWLPVKTTPYVQIQNVTGQWPFSHATLGTGETAQLLFCFKTFFFYYYLFF